jgi:hypothetical protein
MKQFQAENLCSRVPVRDGVLCGYTSSSCSEAQATNGKYGLSAWKINGQFVSSRYNYDLDSSFASGLGQFIFPRSAVRQALCFAAENCENPLNKNATVKVNDLGTANTESREDLRAGIRLLPTQTSHKHLKFVDRTSAVDVPRRTKTAKRWLLFRPVWERLRLSLRRRRACPLPTSSFRCCRRTTNTI